MKQGNVHIGLAEKKRGQGEAVYHTMKKREQQEVYK